jgi:peptidoglycan/LPS O-acetylase OafA/YrhL
VHAATRWTGLAYLGVISFGIYLFHPFVIEAFDRAWFANGRRVSAPPFILAALAATMLVSMMFHYVLERPAMRWGRRLAGASPGPRSRPVRSAPGPPTKREEAPPALEAARSR